MSDRIGKPIRVGQRRQVSWTAYLAGVPPSLWQSALTMRGYTFHEQLDEVGLVHSWAGTS